MRDHGQQRGDVVDRPAIRSPRERLALPLIWAGWLVGAIALGLCRDVVGNPVWLGESSVLLHAGFSLVVIFYCCSHRVAVILGLSLALRSALVFWDLNFKHIYAVPHSGADSEMFFRQAVAVAEDPSLVLADVRGGTFSKLFGLLFWVTGVDRAFGQYTNALLGLSAVLVLSAAMAQLLIRRVRHYQALAVSALLPNFLLLSSVFLRESIIAFLVAGSLYFFIRWFRGGSHGYVVLATSSVLAAASFHAGLIAVGVGYMIVVVTYQREARKFGLSWEGVVYLILFAAIIRFIVLANPDIFLGKFDRFDSGEELLNATNRRRGGSQYLTGLTVGTFTDLIWFGPLRSVYFLGSPMPWDVRSVADALTFLTDSLFYLVTPLLFLIRRKQIPSHQRMLGYAVLTAILISGLIFGAGVSNAGTALRHRFKLMPLFVLLLALIGEERRGHRADRRRPIAGKTDIQSTVPE